MNAILRGALAVLASGLVLAACGGSSAAGSGVASIAGGTQEGGTPAASTTPLTPAQREAALTKAAQCMRDHGVKSFPDPTTDSNGNVQLTGLQGLDRNDPTVRAARTACRPLFRAARPQLTPAQRQQFQDALLAFAKCVRQHGFNMPDPTFGAPGGGGGGRDGGPFGQIDRQDPKFQAASTTCRPALQKAFAGRGGGFGGGGGGGGFFGGGGGGNG